MVIKTIMLISLVEATKLMVTATNSSSKLTRDPKPPK